MEIIIGVSLALLGVAVPVLQREAVEAGGAGSLVLGAPLPGPATHKPSCPELLKQLASQVPCPSPSTPPERARK